MPLHFCLHIQGPHGQFLAGKTSTVAAKLSVSHRCRFLFCKFQALGALLDLILFRFRLHI